MKLRNPEKPEENDKLVKCHITEGAQKEPPKGVLVKGEKNSDSKTDFSAYLSHKARFAYLKGNFLELQQCKLTQEDVQDELETISKPKP